MGFYWVLPCGWDMDGPSQMSGEMCHKLLVKVLSFQVVTCHLEPDLESFKLIIFFFFFFCSHFKQFKPFGVIWSHLKPFQAIWILLKPFRAIWSQTGKPIFFVLLFCIFWFFLGIFPFWHLLEFYWNSLTLLQPFGAISSHLELFWATWSHLEPFGEIWRCLEAFGVISSHCKPFCAIWSNLDQFRAI